MTLNNPAISKHTHNLAGMMLQPTEGSAHDRLHTHANTPGFLDFWQRWITHHGTFPFPITLHAHSGASRP